ncbi:hypothetical protein DYS74_16940 [Sinirhodobacter hankyongi]|uniref:Uncharacterized protein n=2 Tax=Paenirhodobacter hankyongi TaxID=2294033 RepID=A0A421BJK5_9RHOB|nr:hypothetical protein DYS74_16940 [Sinirhodobacter hankyongi]
MDAMSGISASVGTWLVAVGLDGVAKFLGIAPAPTFLGFTLQERNVGAAILVCLVFVGVLFRLTARWRVGTPGDRRELMSRFLGVSRSAG